MLCFISLNGAQPPSAVMEWSTAALGCDGTEHSRTCLRRNGARVPRLWEKKKHAVRKKNLEIPKEKIADFCRKNHIRKLSLFGSILRDDFRPESDIDVLVEFEPGHVPGFIRLASMESELSKILNDRSIDMRTPQDLSRYFRDQVLAGAEVQYG